MSEPIVRPTLVALLEPRRLVPILAVSGVLVATQAVYTRRPFAVALAIAMCLTFILVAPVSFRILFPEETAWSQTLVRIALYCALGIGAVLTVGFVLPRLAGLPRTWLTRRTSLAVCAVLFIVGGWGLGRDVGLTASLRRERARADLLQQKAELAQLLALRAHLDPHFLFNTLQAIAEWCRQDGAVAERAVLRLSELLRAMMGGVRAASWPLSRELELIYAVYDLHLTRDPKFFELQRPPIEDAPDVQVPPMLLLPLAENSVKHGPAAGFRGRISVSLRRVGEELFIAVENPGAFKGRRDGGEGLALVERRLQLAWPKKADLTISDVGGRTRAEVKLPLAEPESA